MTNCKCPDAETLRQYWAGSLAEDSAAKIAEHLATCSRCEATAQSGNEAESTPVSAREGSAEIASGSSRGDVAGDEPSWDSWNDPVPPPSDGVQTPPLAPTPAPLATRDGPQPGSQRPTAAQAGDAAAAGSRYALTRLLARGGLGEVFIARDTELDREVAVKRIRPGLAGDPRGQARFIQEAKLTGSLEHPGIVPLYGFQQDGAETLYAMRLIDGMSLRESIRRFHQSRIARRAALSRTDREFRQLIGQLIAVCQAVAYAHNRRVIHRDIKPENVMCGEFGETLLVDWGIAKPLAHAAVEPPRAGEFADGQPARNSANPAVESSRRAEGTQPLDPASSPAPSQPGPGIPLATAAGTVIGTPHYMSPEQAAGQSAEAGPASDVYALGATLYCILTGSPPHRGKSATEVLDSARSGGFPAPRELLREVPPALDAVCRRALALEPRHRFASPRALAEELENWLADEPVASYREPLWKRASRWTRKHPRISSGTAASVVVGLVALAASLAVFARLNGQLEQTNQRLHTANQRLDDSNQQLQATNQQLDASRKLAEQRAELAQSSLDAVIYRAQRRLKDVPGALNARREILLTGLRGIKALRVAGGLKVRRDRTHAFALLDIGDLLLYHRVPTSGLVLGNAPDEQPAAGSDEPVRLALEAYTLAKEIADQFAAEAPADLPAQYHAAIAEEKQADALFKLGEAEAARRGYETCLTKFEPIARQLGPKQEQYLGPAGPHLKLAIYFLQGAAKREAVETCLKYSRERYAAAPEDAMAERYVGLSLRFLGMLVQDRVRARSVLMESSEVLRRRLQRMPQNTEAKFDLIGLIHQLFQQGVLPLEDDATRGVAEYTLTLSSELVRQDPDSVLYRGLLFQSLNCLRFVFQSTGASDEDLLASYRDLGINEFRQNRWEPAAVSLEIAEAIARSRLTPMPEHQQLLELADILVWYGDALKSLGAGGQAVQKYREAAELLQTPRIDAAAEVLPNRLYNLAWRLGDAEAQAGRWRQAESHFAEATAIAARQHQLAPRSQWKTDLVWVLERFAAAAANAGQREQAAARLQQALEILAPDDRKPSTSDAPRIQQLKEKLQQLQHAPHARQPQPD